MIWSSFFQFDRIAAPTQSSILHAMHKNHEGDIKECPRCVLASQENPLTKVPQSRRWWNETTQHLTNLRTTLIKKKILPSPNKRQTTSKLFVNSLVHSTKRIDEIVAKSSVNLNIPIYPKLKLSRPKKHKNKVQVPIAVTLVQFPHIPVQLQNNSIL